MPATEGRRKHHVGLGAHHCSVSSRSQRSAAAPPAGLRRSALCTAGVQLPSAAGWEWLRAWKQEGGRCQALLVERRTGSGGNEPSADTACCSCVPRTLLPVRCRHSHAGMALPDSPCVPFSWPAHARCDETPHRALNRGSVHGFATRRTVRARVTSFVREQRASTPQALRACALAVRPHYCSVHRLAPVWAPQGRTGVALVLGAGRCRGAKRQCTCLAPTPWLFGLSGCAAARWGRRAVGQGALRRGAPGSAGIPGGLLTGGHGDRRRPESAHFLVESVE